jgi:hypothetical protein
MVASHSGKFLDTDRMRTQPGKPHHQAAAISASTTNCMPT